MPRLLFFFSLFIFLFWTYYSFLFFTVTQHELLKRGSGRELNSLCFHSQPEWLFHKIFCSVIIQCLRTKGSTFSCTPSIFRWFFFFCMLLSHNVIWHLYTEIIYIFDWKHRMRYSNTKKYFSLEYYIVDKVKEKNQSLFIHYLLVNFLFVFFVVTVICVQH